MAKLLAAFKLKLIIFNKGIDYEYMFVYVDGQVAKLKLWVFIK